MRRLGDFLALTSRLQRKTLRKESYPAGSWFRPTEDELSVVILGGVSGRT